MRFSKALEILRRIDGYSGGASSPFIWRKAWLARQSLVAGSLFNPASPLRRIPGLRYSRLPGLLAKGWREEPFELVTAADAIQVGESGDRLRAFRVKDASTLKVVQEASHYGPATRREIALRAEIKGYDLLVPAITDHETRDGYLFIREELIEGRAFNIRTDRHLFCEQVISPLASFYERHGIVMMPLAEALGPMAAFAAGERLSRLISENPQVAVSLCHNDVVSSNLAVSRKGVYFLDWGSALLSLCGRDFVRIGEKYLKDAAIRQQMQAQISRLQRGKLGLEDMLLIQQLWRDYIEYHGDAKIDSGARPAALTG